MSLIPTRFCLVRHGETDWNIERRLQGQIDIPLNQTGQQQAQSLSRALATADTRFAALYVSDLSRTRQTADAICQLNPLQAITTAALRERHFGCFQGLTYAEAEAHIPQDYQQFKARTPDYTPGDGESLQRFSQRIEQFLQQTARRHQGETVLVVTHGGVLDIIYRLVKQLPITLPRDFPIPNAALNWISHSHGLWQMERWADQSHLDHSMDEL